MCSKSVTRLHALLDIWNLLPDHVDLNLYSLDLVRCTQDAEKGECINHPRRKLLAIKQNNFSLATADVDYAAAPTQETDLTSRLWETEGTDPTIATLRKRLIDRNAPAAMWGAIGEDDIAKMDELRRYGSEITQGYLATVGEDEKHALKALVGTTLSKAEQAVSAAKLGVAEAKNMGGVSERKRAEEDLKSLEKERDALLQAKAGAEASDHEGIKVGISTATVDDKCNVNITLKDDMPLAPLMSVKVEGVEYMQINGDVSITHVQNKKERQHTHAMKPKSQSQVSIVVGMSAYRLRKMQKFLAPCLRDP